jgi:hypothetical protein
MGTGLDFLSRTQKLRERMDKWDYTKFKKLLHNKRNGLYIKDHPQSGRKYLLTIHQTKD